MHEIAGDLFATKGLEYLLVIGYLLLLVLCWRFVRPRKAGADGTAEPAGAGPRAAPVQLPDGYYFHPGHAWARPDGAGAMRVGMDEAAWDLLGVAPGLSLPDIGETLTAGEPGWFVVVGGHRLPVLSPVDGTVVARNADVGGTARPPDAYGRDWILEVAVPNPVAASRNLLTNGPARAWLRADLERLSELEVPGSTDPSRNGGPEEGHAREIPSETRARAARRLLLADGSAAPDANDRPEGVEAGQREVQNA